MRSVKGVKDVRRLTALLVLSLLAVSGCAQSHASTPAAEGRLPCPAKPTGALCIKVFAHHLEVDDAIGYLVSSEPTLMNKTWRLVLTSYSCDPGEAVQPKCAASGVFPGPTRHGLPPAATSCRVPATGAITTAPPGCHDTVAQAMGSHGDWAGLVQLGDGKPMTFPHRVWLCVSEQVLSGIWSPPDPRDSPTPLRACERLNPN